MVAFANVHFVLFETWNLEIYCTDVDGNPLDLTGATVRMRVASGSTVLLDLAIGTGLALAPDPTTGVVQAVVTPAMQSAVSALTAGTYKYEVRVTLSSGDVSTQAAGQVSVLPSLFSS